MGGKLFSRTYLVTFNVSIFLYSCMAYRARFHSTQDSTLNLICYSNPNWYWDYLFAYFLIPFDFEYRNFFCFAQRLYYQTNKPTQKQENRWEKCENFAQECSGFPRLLLLCAITQGLVKLCFSSPTIIQNTV